MDKQAGRRPVTTSTDPIIELIKLGRQVGIRNNTQKVEAGHQTVINGV